MATNTEEKKNVTGLDTATNRQETEYDLVTALLEAAEYKTDAESITEVEIKRAGKFLFSVHIHPISDPDTRFARKKATTYTKDPRGKHLPLLEKEFNNPKFKSWVIYLATTEEDQKKIWGNSQVMQRHGLAEPWESIDVLLTSGEKAKLLEEVTKISGLNDDDDDDDYDEDGETEGKLSEEEYAKN